MCHIPYVRGTRRILFNRASVKLTEPVMQSCCLSQYEFVLADKTFSGVRAVPEEIHRNSQPQTHDYARRVGHRTPTSQANNTNRASTN